MPAQQTPPIWDLPLRLFHWLLVVAVAGAILSGQNGWWFWHEKFGLTVLGLLVFRLIWGVIGGKHARFVHFRLAPAKVLGYLQQRRDTLFTRPASHAPTHAPGHSPFGAWATLVILGVLLALAISGNLAHNGILFEGPIARLFGIGTLSDFATRIHRSLEKVVIAIIALHILAIIGYRLLWGIRLLPAMLRDTPDPTATTSSYRGSQIGGIVLLLVCIGLAQGLGFASQGIYL